MGQAKRRKELGLMPEPTQKQRNTARARIDHMDSMMGMGSMATILASLMMGSNLGRNFAMRSEMARMNREIERPQGIVPTESA